MPKNTPNPEALQTAAEAVLHQLAHGEAGEGDKRDIAWCIRALRQALGKRSRKPEDAGRRAGMLIRITPEQIEALGYILDLAHGDQEHWLNAGNSSVDYGDDWPRVANMKAAQFRAVAQVAGVLIAGERERWEALAGAMVLDAVETSIPDGGE